MKYKYLNLNKKNQKQLSENQQNINKMSKI